MNIELKGESNRSLTGQKTKKTKGEIMFIEYIDNKIQELKNEEMVLGKEDRKDEANFVKIKINICDTLK